MKITIVGAGNVGTQFAVHCAEKGHQVIIYGSKPDRIDRNLTIFNEEDEIIHKGGIFGATNDARTAFESADVIFITYPAFCMKEIADEILPYAKEGMKIGLVPGTGGGECAFIEALEKGAIIFGLQRVPSVARLREYGKSVCAIGYRDSLHVGALPCDAVDECSSLISKIFDKNCISLPNYLNVTLTPSNPILHTTRLKNLFQDYQEGVVYENVPLFYEGWNDETSEILLRCDDEVQRICQNLSMFDLSYVKSLRVHYGSFTPEELTKKIVSIQGFKGLSSPVIKVEKGYIPDLQSRYFTADFPYGLAILDQIADLVELEVPYIKDTLNWYYNLVGNKDQYKFSDYGIDNLEKFIKFYKR